MQGIFSEQGIPEKLVSDNGPHFTSDQFRTFAAEWGFDHVTSSPHRAQGNGFVERQIKTAKDIITKAKESGTNPHLALLHWRATPISIDIPSPAQTNLGRKVKTILPSKCCRTTIRTEDTQQALVNRQNAQKSKFDRHALSTELPVLHPGQHVLVQHHITGKWEPGNIHERRDPRSYVVSVGGRLLRRNRQHIRTRPVPEVEAEVNATPEVAPPSKHECPLPQKQGKDRNTTTRRREIRKLSRYADTLNVSSNPSKGAE